MNYDRGRITIPDLIMMVFGVAVVAGLQPVFSSMLDNTLQSTGPMTSAALQVFLPAVALLMIAIVAGRATGGLRR